jgi:putative ABC transport system permease protein
MWTEMLDAPEFLKGQYDLIAGKWPEGAEEAVLIVSETNRVSDFLLYSLGLRGPDDIQELIDMIMEVLVDGGGSVNIPIDRDLAYSYDEIMDLSYSIVLPFEHYAKTADGWVDKSNDSVYMQGVYSSAAKIDIVGILRQNPDAAAMGQSGIIGYTSDLTRYIIDKTNDAEIVKAQLADPETDVFTGLPFEVDDDAAPAFAKMQELYGYIQSLTGDEQAQAVAAVRQMQENGMSDDRILEIFNQNAAPQGSSNTYAGNLDKLKVADLDSPSSVLLYPSSFDNKEELIAYIDAYNEDVGEEQEITYTDYVGLLMSSVTTVINAISYILIAFVSISLVVSSIMIGIITYISVLERTKEIGILRSIGASKRDISRVFNAETLIIGFVAGALGIAVTLLLNIPANIIIFNLTEINNVSVMPFNGAVALVIISMALSFIAGLIPSRVAANKDPVVALRTE